MDLLSRKNSEVKTRIAISSKSIKKLYVNDKKFNPEIAAYYYSFDDKDAKKIRYTKKFRIPTKLPSDDYLGKKNIIFINDGQESDDEGVNYILTQKMFNKLVSGNSPHDDYEQSNSNIMKINNEFVKPKETYFVSKTKTTVDQEIDNTPTNAEKTTYCRPAMNICNRDIICKTLQKNVKLQDLITRLVLIREREKKQDVWNNYINKLKNKHKIFSKPVHEQDMPIKITNDDIIDYYDTKYNWKISDLCQNLLDDVYSASSSIYTEEVREPPPTSNLKFHMFDKKVCFPTSSQGRLLDKTFQKEALLNSQNHFRGNTIIVPPEKKYSKKYNRKNTYTNIECKCHLPETKAQGTQGSKSNTNKKNLAVQATSSTKTIEGSSTKVGKTNEKHKNLSNERKTQGTIVVVSKHDIHDKKILVQAGPSTKAVEDSSIEVEITNGLDENLSNERKTQGTQDSEHDAHDKKISVQAGPSTEKNEGTQDSEHDAHDKKISVQAGPSTETNKSSSKEIEKTNEKHENLSNETKIRFHHGQKVVVQARPSTKTIDSLSKEVEKTKESLSHHKTNDKVTVSKTTRQESLANIESKIDTLIVSINELIQEIRSKNNTKNAEASCDLDKEKETKTPFSTNDSAVVNYLHKQIICGLVQEKTRNMFEERKKRETIEDILFEEFNKSDQAKRDIEEILGKTDHGRSVQLAFDVPTKERSTEVSESLCNSETSSRKFQNYNKDCRSMTMAVNTEPLGVFALLRVSTDTVKKILSYMPQINYNAYLPRLTFSQSTKMSSGFTCNICGASFDKPSKLSAHIEQHDLGNTRNCCVCRHALDMKKSRAGLFACRYCGQRFTRAYCRELHEQDCASIFGQRHDVTPSRMFLH